MTYLITPPFVEEVREFRIEDLNVYTRLSGEEEWSFDPGNTAMRERLHLRATSSKGEERET
jgi:hypothetical protein